MVWEDVLVVSDDGRSTPSDYEELLEIALELAQTCPYGIGMLIIIEENAVPPSDEVRAAINSAMQACGKYLRGVVWCVETAGFQAAMIRAVLLGIRFLSNAPYARHTADDLEQSLTWLLPLLHGGKDRLSEVKEAAAFIRRRRSTVRSAVLPTPTLQG